MLAHIIEQRLREAVASLIPEVDTSSILVQPCANPAFGDLQTSAFISIAKARGLNPRQFAQTVVSRLNVEDVSEPPEVAGPGFVNFRLKSAAITSVLKEAAAGKHLFFDVAESPKTIVIDFSSPNVAKPMHVGHIRSTILGDCLARVLRLLGHKVITDNHLGDWGTQFGKLIVGWKKYLNRAALENDPGTELERVYKLVNAECESNPEVLEAARKELVKLQAGDPENLRLWREMTSRSQVQFDVLYKRLGVQFDYTLGESFYNPMLPQVVEELVRRGIARESEGAMVVFFEGDPELQAHPAIILKSDGAANYATTDLATLEYRLKTWNPQEIIYVTDARQQLHFKQIFAIFRRWHPEASHVKLVHVWFGSILGPDGKPFKTRSGDTVKLAELLDEAEERALKIVDQKQPDLPEAERREIARIVGIGAVKYADLLPNRQSDYVFDWDKLLALNGNTAPYLQYAYTRIQSIFRKRGHAATPAEPPASFALGHFELESNHELRLAKHLLGFGTVLEAVAREYRPNYLCNYLFELAGCFTDFYENCPVLKAPEPTQSNRLLLCDLTARVLKQGLEVLGIGTPERM
ncbi:MAG: arginine--tRNA ligase [Verrucomicrobiae bacterium]|nr:arginine--tRNA ligase [Verrucomicrobiae bacterium]